MIVYHQHLCSNICSIKLFLTSSNQDLTTLTLHSNEGFFSCRTSNTIISSTSVTSLVLSTDVQREGDISVIRKSCPGDSWCRITSCITEQSHTLWLIYCLVSSDVSDVWRNWKIKQKNVKKCWKFDFMSLQNNLKVGSGQVWAFVLLFFLLFLLFLQSIHFCLPFLFSRSTCLYLQNKKALGTLNPTVVPHS